MLLLDYVPVFVSNTKEIKVLFQLLQQEINNLKDKIEEVLSDMFVLNSSEYATERYENIVGICPKLSQGLLKRQLNILSIYNEVPPFTFEKLEEMLIVLLGENEFKIKIDVVNFELTILLSKKSLQFQETIDNMLERVVPLNISLNYKIDWNTWRDLKAFNWNKIKSVTWLEVKEKEEFDGEKH